MVVVWGNWVEVPTEAGGGAAGQRTAKLGGDLDWGQGVVQLVSGLRNWTVVFEVIVDFLSAIFVGFRDTELCVNSVGIS